MTDEQVQAGWLVARQLAAEGVDTLFTLTGGHISPVFEGCRRAGIRLVDVRHEQSAVMAADALARVRRAPAAAAVTAGPGLTNAVTGIANAHAAQSPVVVLGGRNPIGLDGLAALQDAPQLDLVRPVVKRADVVIDGPRAAEYVEWAVTAALSGRPGPAYVDLPLDVQLTPLAAAAAVVPRQRRFTAPPGPDPDAVERVARLLNGARRPVVVAGTGAYWGRAEEELRELAGLLGAPLFLNGMARGMVPADDRCLLQLTRKAAIAGADVLLVLGADFDFRLGFGRGPEFGGDLDVVHVDVAADQLGRNRAVTEGVVSDVGSFLRALLALAGKFAHVADPDWLPALRAEEARREAERAAAMTADTSPVHPMRFAAEVARAVDPDAVLIGDGGDIVSLASTVLRANRPGHWLDPGPFGCLGVGIPFALGARIARPGAQVVAVMGDGAFGFNALEIDSAVRQRLPFVAVVGNDGAWGEMRTFHEQLYGTADMSAQYLSQATRYDLVATALGGYGERVERPEEIRPAFERACESGLPAVVDVVLDQTYRYRSGPVVAPPTEEPSP